MRTDTFRGVFERTRLGRSDRDPDQIPTVRVVVERGSSVVEEVPVEPLREGRSRALATPGLAQGFAADDVFELDAHGDAVVVERAGNVGVQILAERHDLAQVADLIDAAERLGGWLDGFEERVVVVTVPVGAGFPAIESLVRRYVAGAGDAVEWYYANVYAADGRTPLASW